MDISWMTRRQVAAAICAAVLCMAGVPGYGGSANSGAAAPQANAGAQGGSVSESAVDVAGDVYRGADTYHIVNLSPGEGYRSRINAKGKAAFEYVSLAYRARVGFFDGDLVSDISPPGADSAALGDMNEKSDVTQYTALPYNGGFNLRPFRWSQAAGWTLLPVLKLEGESFTSAMNDAGTIVGSSGISAVENAYRAVRWGANNKLLPLATAAGYGESTAYGINAQGVSVGTANDPNGKARAFIWNAAGTPIDLGTFGKAEAAGLINNNHGEIAGWLNFFDPDFQAFLWNPVQGVVPVGAHSLAAEMNNAGELVGRVYDPATGIDHAYVFSRAHGLVDLHRAPYTSSEANHLNDSGTVVGEMWSNTPGAGIHRGYRWARNGKAVDLNTRLLDVPDGLIVTQALRISPSGDIIANSSAGLVLLRRASGTNAPVVGPIQMPDVVHPAEAVSLALSFRDRNKQESHSATVDWGDGSGPQAAGVSESKGQGALSAAHTYANAGFYTIVVRVTDSAGRVTSQARHLDIFPYCVPGIVGGGSLASDVGRTAQPTVIFRLSAPLVSACGRSTPFTFLMQGGVGFQGERLERVSRNGNTVHLEGTGKLGGQPGYRFSIDATDGQHGGALDKDRMSIRIDHADASGAARSVSTRPAVFSYGVASNKADARQASHQGSLPPTALRLID